jgi:hypothetical protein
LAYELQMLLQVLVNLRGTCRKWFEVTWEIAGACDSRYGVQP